MNIHIYIWNKSVYIFASSRGQPHRLLFINQQFSTTLGKTDSFQLTKSSLLPLFTVEGQPRSLGDAPFWCIFFSHQYHKKIKKKKT